MKLFYNILTGFLFALIDILQSGVKQFEQFDNRRDGAVMVVETNTHLKLHLFAVYHLWLANLNRIAQLGSEISPGFGGIKRSILIVFLFC